MKWFRKLFRRRGRLTIISTSEHQDFYAFGVRDSATIYNSSDIDHPPFGLFREDRDHLVVILNPWKLNAENEDYGKLYREFKEGRLKTFHRRIRHGYCDTRDEPL